MNAACLAVWTPGFPELLLILVVVMLLFGAKRLPDLARSLGRSMSEFKKGREAGSREIDARSSSQNSTDERDKSDKT